MEVAWRLARRYWGQGYATEAARAALDYGFGELGLEEIVALTVPANRRSCRVRERQGMTRRPEDDFDHSTVPEAPLKRCVPYRLSKPERGRSFGGAARIDLFSDVVDPMARKTGNRNDVGFDPPAGDLVNDRPEPVLSGHRRRLHPWSDKKRGRGRPDVTSAVADEIMRPVQVTAGDESDGMAPGEVE